MVLSFQVCPVPHTFLSQAGNPPPTCVQLSLAGISWRWHLQHPRVSSTIQALPSRLHTMAFLNLRRFHNPFPPIFFMALKPAPHGPHCQVLLPAWAEPGPSLTYFPYDFHCSCFLERGNPWDLFLSQVSGLTVHFTFLFALHALFCWSA